MNTMYPKKQCTKKNDSLKSTKELLGKTPHTHKTNHI